MSARELSPETKADLHRQLVRLGDMMGDGCHHEPGGKWIEREYAKICRALGIIPRRKVNTAAVDERMAQRVAEFPCGECGGKLEQTRKGSMVAKCACGARYKLLKAARRKG